MKTFLSILLFVTLSTHAQTTLIPDPNFEQALISLGYDNGPINGYIITSNISNVDNLHISNLSISNLIGIEDFTMLEVLICDHNNLSSIDVSHNTNLLYLDCGQNQITSLNLAQNTSLENLRCPNNLLTNLDISQNTLLEYFYCGYNQLTNLDISQNTNLTTLGINENLITSLGVGHLPNLEGLFCNNNELVTIDVSQNPLLKTFWCNNNYLTSLNVSQNLDLEYFYCGNNELTHLNVVANTELIRFSCYNNLLYCLNLKNSNNTTIEYFASTINYNLTCIEVDDVAWSVLNWDIVDDETYFSSECNTNCGLGNNEVVPFNFTVYPNPTKNEIAIELNQKSSILNLKLTNKLGQVLLFDNYISTKSIKLYLDYLPNGIYFLTFETQNQTFTKKIIII